MALVVRRAVHRLLTIQGAGAGSAPASAIGGARSFASSRDDAEAPRARPPRPRSSPRWTRGRSEGARGSASWTRDAWSGRRSLRPRRGAAEEERLERARVEAEKAERRKVKDVQKAKTAQRWRGRRGRGSGRRRRRCGGSRCCAQKGCRAPAQDGAGGAAQGEQELGTQGTSRRTIEEALADEEDVVKGEGGCGERETVRRFRFSSRHRVMKRRENESRVWSRTSKRVRPRCGGCGPTCRAHPDAPLRGSEDRNGVREGTKIDFTRSLVMPKFFWYCQKGSYTYKSARLASLNAFVAQSVERRSHKKHNRFGNEDVQTARQTVV